MAPSNIGYSLRECGHHFRRNWTTVLGAVVTIFLSLFIIGLFVLGSVMINNMVGSVEDTVTIQAFLSDDADQSAVTAFQEKVKSWNNVESVTYKDKDQALEEYRTSMSNRNAADAVAALDGENPLPASLVIKLTDPQQVEDAAQKIIADTDFQSICDDADNPAGDVNYGRQTVERLFSVANYIRIAAVVLVALLTFVALCLSTTPSAWPSRPAGARSPSCAWSAPPTASSAGPSSWRAPWRPLSPRFWPLARWPLAATLFWASCPTP